MELFWIKSKIYSAKKCDFGVKKKSITTYRIKEDLEIIACTAKNYILLIHCPLLY